MSAPASRRHDPHQELTDFLVRLTLLQLMCSGEGAEDIEQPVNEAARQLGGEAALLVVPDGATLSVDSHGRRTTVGVRGFPKIFRMGQLAAIKPLLRDIAAGTTDVADADRRLIAIIDSPPPQPDAVAVQPDRNVLSLPHAKVR